MLAKENASTDPIKKTGREERDSKIHRIRLRTGRYWARGPVLPHGAPPVAALYSWRSHRCTDEGDQLMLSRTDMPVFGGESTLNCATVAASEDIAGTMRSSRAGVNSAGESRART